MNWRAWSWPSSRCTDMKKFWALIGKGLAKAAGWALGNPEELIAIVTTIRDAKKGQK